MKIIDACTFYNSVDILKMRLRMHYDHVDAFYICESDHTYSGKPKPFNLEPRLHELEQWGDKIHYIKHHADLTGLDFTQEFKEEILNLANPAWILEFRQRNQLKEAVKNIMADDDVIAICDIDEFIDHDVFKFVRENGLMCDHMRLHMVMHHNYMNCVQPGKTWTHPFMCTGKKLREIDDVSFHRHTAAIPFWWPDAGWHFSHLGGYEAIMDKFEITCHTEYVLNNVNEPSYVKACMKYGILPNIRKEKPTLSKCEFAYARLDVYPEYLRKIMLDNPQFIVTDLNAKEGTQ
jgi:beta-1,4-mannosyl-glycoprotein beta-1,4-N-acetylglucosaminyltransferase